MDLVLHIERFGRRLAEVEVALSAPDVFAQPQKAQELGREHARLKELVSSGARYLKVCADLAASRAMVAAEPPGSELAQLAEEEAEALETEAHQLGEAIQYGLLPPDPNDSRNTIVEIRAGAGGAESALFAADLFRMYSRYAETQKWTVESMEASPSDLGGLKEVVFSVTGQDAYRRLKFESGVHRVQRVPATEAQGRIHTSTATVAVLPEAQEVDVEIRPDDLEINVCRASGHGGQGVNTTDSAVRIFHKPSGIEVRCQDGRSQQKNKTKALTVLRARLLERRIAEEKAKYDAERSGQVGTGERSEKIRTYNFPQNRVTDHRIELTLYNLAQIVDGALDGVIEPLLKDELHHRLATVSRG